MKLITFLAAKGNAEDFGRWVLEDFAPELALRIAGCAVNIVMPGEAPPSWHVVLETWSDSAEALPEPQAAELRSRCECIASYRVLELVEKDDGVPRGRPAPGIKLMAPWIARSDVERSEIRRHWDEHVPLANRIHVGARRYVRNWVEFPAGPAAPPYQGIAFQYFDSRKDLIERSFDRPESVQLIADDVADFIARHEVLLTTEYLLKAPPDGGRESIT